MRTTVENPGSTNTEEIPVSAEHTEDKEFTSVTRDDSNVLNQAGISTMSVASALNETGLNNEDIPVEPLDLSPIKSDGGISEVSEISDKDRETMNISQNMSELEQKQPTVHTETNKANVSFSFLDTVSALKGSSEIQLALETIDESYDRHVTCKKTDKLELLKGNKSLINIVGVTTPPVLITDKSLMEYRDSNERGHKRKRHNTRGSFEKILVGTKIEDSSCTNKNVQFDMFQNEQQADQMEDDEEPYQVMKGAVPLWLIAKKHATQAKKSELRLASLEKQTSEGRPPLWTMGLAIPPEYMRPLPPVFLDLFKRQSMEVADLVKRELNIRRLEDRKIYATYMEMIRQMYSNEDNADFLEAQARINGIRVQYAEEEQKRLDAYERREAKRYPKDNPELAEMLQGRGRPAEIKPGNDPRARSGSRGRKRRRDNSSDRERSSGNDKVVPSTSTNPNTSSNQNQRGRSTETPTYRGRGYPQRGRPFRGRGRGAYQGGRGAPGNRGNAHASRGFYQQRGGQARGAAGGRGRGTYSPQERSLIDSMKDLLKNY